MNPPLTPPPKQDTLKHFHNGPPKHLTKRGGGINNPNNTGTADISTVISPVQTNKSGKKAKFDSTVPMDMETLNTAKKASGTNTPKSRLNARCMIAAAQKNQGVTAPGARPSGTANGLTPFTINMNYKKKSHDRSGHTV